MFADMKPTYLLEVWLVGDTDNLNFSQIEQMGFSEAKEYFDYHKLVNGKSATVWVFFSDYEISNSQIVNAATKFMKGEYTRIDVDLKHLTTTETKGVDKTNPRQ